MIHHGHTVSIGEFAAGGDTKQNVLRACMFFPQIMDIVCCNEGDFKLFGELDQLGVGFFLFFDPVILHFQEEIFFAEDIKIL